MAVLNPPSALPGLARSIVNHLLSSRAVYDEPRLTALFAPSQLGEGDVTRGVDNTLRACRAVDVLVQGEGQRVSVSSRVEREANGAPLSRDRFRSVLRACVLDSRRDGDPWLQGEGRTSGGKDLTRALAWFLSQDALGPPLSWRAQGDGNVQALQARQLPDTLDEDRPILNDTRWGSFTRWVVALGFAEAATAGGSQGLVPVPVRAIRDAVITMAPGSRPVDDFLGALVRELPVLPGGAASNGLRNILTEEPDPSARGGGVASGLSQSLLILEDEGLLTMDYGADAAVTRTLLEDGDARPVSTVTIAAGPAT